MYILYDTCCGKRGGDDSHFMGPVRQYSTYKHKPTLMDQLVKLSQLFSFYLELIMLYAAKLIQSNKTSKYDKYTYHILLYTIFS